jgi:hypothetical protein
LTFVNPCDEFYRQFYRRTNEYVDTRALDSAPVHVSIGDDASKSHPGQTAAVALLNLLARSHRVLTVDLPEAKVPLLIDVPLGYAGTLAECLFKQSRSIDPCGEFRLGPTPPDGCLSIGIGREARRDCQWYLGAQNSIALLNKSPQDIGRSEGTLRGAGLAAILGAAAMFRTQLRMDTAPRVLSCWNYEEADRAEEGPSSLQALDVGRILLIGAGAVGSSLGFWIRFFGWAGACVIVDKDQIEIHNLNRSLLFTAADAGWPTGPAKYKCDVLADALPNSVPVRSWYDEYIADKPSDFDVVLCLANERGIRHELACRNFSVVLHATTGTNWTSQLHRHIPGMDDCVFCRAGEIKPVQFGCSTGGIVTPAGEQSDAALPFLSAASGLMLATLLQRLQSGCLTSLDCNDWRWDFNSHYRMASKGKRRCSESCTRVSSKSIRDQLHVKGRWKHLEQ